MGEYFVVLLEVAVATVAFGGLALLMLEQGERRNDGLLNLVGSGCAVVFFVLAMYTVIIAGPIIGVAAIVLLVVAVLRMVVYSLGALL